MGRLFCVSATIFSNASSSCAEAPVLRSRSRMREMGSVKSQRPFWSEWFPKVSVLTARPAHLFHGLASFVIENADGGQNIVTWIKPEVDAHQHHLCAHPLVLAGNVKHLAGIVHVRVLS